MTVISRKTMAILTIVKGMESVLGTDDGKVMDSLHRLSTTNTRQPTSDNQDQHPTNKINSRQTRSTTDNQDQQPTTKINNRDRQPRSTTETENQDHHRQPRSTPDN
jgi:hypothetical protein